MRNSLLIAAAAWGLAVAQPAFAQDTDQDAGEAAREAEMMTAFTGLFAAEPLTADQEARLPQARALVTLIMPPGTLGEIMGGMYDKLLNPIMGLAGKPNTVTVAKELGLDPGQLDLDEAQAEQALAIVDPAWRERQRVSASTMQEVLTRAMVSMEPAMRVGLAEAYATNFTSAELTDIAAFFSTPSGLSYARKSYAMASDPRIMAASLKAMPAMMSEMRNLEDLVTKATAALPAKRGYGELSDKERDTLSELLGLPSGEIAKAMATTAGHTGHTDD